MLFNSLQFVAFFVIVYSLYLTLSHKWQNRMLLVASYVFYGAWDWRFLSLIGISTVIDYICGLKIHQAQDIWRRRLILYVSIFSNLIILGYFKYFGFFAANLQILLNKYGLSTQPLLLHAILPLGISFYTFQTMGYTIDIYRREMAPTKKFTDYALFVAFFPQLVAGPIEKAKHLLPQILFPRKATSGKIYEGCYLIFWGLFMKVFVADNLASIVDPIFASNPPYNGVMVLVAIYAFAFQIFCDFAGYSNIARGLAKAMGFDLTINFNCPYFSTNPREFWARWHISLSRWLRDYLYIPLGGNKKGTVMTCRNLGITMLLGGLWHGAAWTFIIWGAYHGLLLVVYRLFMPILEKMRSPKNIFVQRTWFFIKVAFFFHLTCLGWLIFRAQSVSQVFQMLQGVFMNISTIHGVGLRYFGFKMLFFLWLLAIVQLIQYWKNDLMAILKFNSALKGVLYFVCFFLLSICGVEGGKEFIYFVF